MFMWRTTPQRPDLKVCLAGKGPVLNVVDVILGEVEVREVGETVHRGEQHRLQLVLIQTQVMHLSTQDVESQP